VALGVLGVLLCAAALGLGWWAAAKVADRVNRAAARLDHGLVETDARLRRVEDRLAAIRADVDGVRGEADRLAAENPELPRAKAAVERVLDRLLAVIERAGTLADALRAVAGGLRAAEDVVTQLGVEIPQPSRADRAAAAIDSAAALVNIPKDRLDRVKSSAAGRFVRELVELAREAAAGAERLAEALAEARREVAAARDRTAGWRDTLVRWVYLAAVVNTLAWMWFGVGQWCLMGWGRWSARRPRLWAHSR
jgi:hypothetical protein